MIQIFDCEQNSDEWLQARLGIPTASEFSTVLAKGRDGGDSKTRRTYLLKLAGERITGQPADSYTNHHMERGHEMEQEALDFYAFMHDAELQKVGFIRNGEAGCSPDRLIGSNGMVEVKTKAPHLMIDLMLKDKFPPEHKAQCQGQLWIAEREWVDLIAYWPDMPKFVKRAYRDEEYIAKLAAAVDEFNTELREIVGKIEGRAEAA